MASPLRCLPRLALRAARSCRAPLAARSFSHLSPLLSSTPAAHPQPPSQDLKGGNRPASAPLGTAKRLPEFNLEGKVVLVSGAARGLGLVQAEALLEAGATGLSPSASTGLRGARKSLTKVFLVYALDRLEKPSPDFERVRTRAASELGTSLTYRRIDVREVKALNAIVQEIADKHQRLDGLVAAAGIQQETPALEYTAADCDKILGVNVTGVFMTAQAAAKQMIRFGNGGSIVLIASMSGTIANRVCFPLPP